MRTSALPIVVIFISTLICSFGAAPVRAADESSAPTPAPAATSSGADANQSSTVPVAPPSPEPDRPVKIPDLPDDKVQTAPFAYLLRVNPPHPKITGLEIADSRVPIIMIAKDKDIKPTIGVRGMYSRKGWKLFTIGGQQPLTNEFTIYAHLKGRLNEVEFVAVGPNNEREVEKVYVYSPSARTFHVVSPWEDLLFSTGLANFSYAQTGFGLYESIEAIASVRYGSPDTDAFVTFLASAEMTVVALATSPIPTSPQLFEAKGDLSFRTNSQPMRRMRHRLLVGATYVTMFANGSPFGFSDLAAFELGAQSRYIANPKVDWIAELRYMPIGGLAVMTDYGVNLSIAWSRLLENSRRAEVALMYSAYNYHPSDVVAIQTSLFTLRLGLTL